MIEIPRWLHTGLPNKSLNTNKVILLGRRGGREGIHLLVCHTHFLIITFWCTVSILFNYFTSHHAPPPSPQKICTAAAFHHNTILEHQYYVQDSGNSGFSNLATDCEDLPICTLNCHTSMGLQTHCSNQVWLITNQYWPAMGKSQNTGAFLLGFKSLYVKEYKQEEYTLLETRRQKVANQDLALGKPKVASTDHLLTTTTSHGLYTKSWTHVFSGNKRTRYQECSARWR